MTYDDPQVRPGCFGQALTYSEEHGECRACPFATLCRPASEAALARLRDTFGIKLAQRDKKRLKEKVLTPSGREMTLPKKVEELLTRIEQAGIRVSEVLAAGKNPFGSKFMFMRCAAHLLLCVSEGFTQRQLTRALELKLEWSRSTAAAHASQAFQALEALGVAQQINGRLVLKR